MKRLALIGLIFAAACEPVPGGGSTPAAASGPGMREFLVIGNRMSFERCRSIGGLIIRDTGTAMVACDPTVRGEPVPADEFNHPDI